MEWLIFLRPYRTTADFEPYFMTYKALHEKNEHYRICWWRVTLLQLNNFAWCVSFVLLWLWPHSHYEAVMHADAIQVFGRGRPWARLFYIPFMGMIAFTTNQLYFRLDPRINRMTKLILINCLDTHFRPTLRYEHRENAARYIQTKVLKYHWIHKIMIIPADLFLIYVQVVITFYLVTRAPDYFVDSNIDPKLGATIAVFLWQLRFLSGVMGFAQIAFAINMCVVVSSVAMLTALIRFWQARQVLAKMPRTRFVVGVQIAKFLQLHRQAVLLVLRVNSFVGGSIFSYLFASLPGSCMLLMLMFYQPRLIPNILNGFAVLVHLFGILVLHLAIVVENRKVSQPNQQIYSFLADERNQLTWKQKTQLLLYLLQYHRLDYPDGFTYYKMNIITMRSFLECLLIYLQLFMHAFRLVSHGNLFAS